MSTQTTASVNLNEDVGADTSTSKVTKDRPSQVLGASEEAHAVFTQELKKDSPVYESASDEDVFSPIESSNWNAQLNRIIYNTDKTRWIINNYLFISNLLFTLTIEFLKCKGKDGCQFWLSRFTGKKVNEIRNKK